MPAGSLRVVSRPAKTNKRVSPGGGYLRLPPSAKLDDRDSLSPVYIRQVSVERGGRSVNKTSTRVDSLLIKSGQGGGASLSIDRHFWFIEFFQNLPDSKQIEDLFSIVPTKIKVAKIGMRFVEN